MVIQVLILIAGFLLLVKGADWFVDGPACRKRQSVSRQL